MEANKIIASMVGLSLGQKPVLNGEQVKSLLKVVKNDVLLDERTKRIFTSLKTFDDLQEVIVKNGTNNRLSITVIQRVVTEFQPDKILLLNSLDLFIKCKAMIGDVLLRN